MAKCNSHTILVKSCFVPRKCIVPSEFLHKTRIYAIILKSIKNAYFYFFIVKKQDKILVCGKKHKERRSGYEESIVLKKLVPFISVRYCKYVRYY